MGEVEGRRDGSFVGTVEGYETEGDLEGKETEGDSEGSEDEGNSEGSENEGTVEGKLLDGNLKGDPDGIGVVVEDVVVVLFEPRVVLTVLLVNVIKINNS